LSCPWQRKYDQDHPVCHSCQTQGIRCSTRKTRSAKRRTHSSGPVEIGGEKVMLCQTDLRTPNDWTNKRKGREIYLGEQQKWRRLFRNVFFLWGPQKEGVRRRLHVVRRVPNSTYLIKDFDNRVFTLKPLEDALKKAGVLIDDSEKYLESVPPDQKVDPGIKEPVVEVRLCDIPAN